MKNQDWQALGYRVAYYCNHHRDFSEIPQQEEDMCWRKVLPNRTSIVVTSDGPAPFEQGEQDTPEDVSGLSLPDCDGPYQIAFFKTSNNEEFSAISFISLRGDEYDYVVDGLLKGILIGAENWLGNLSDEEIVDLFGEDE